MALRRLGSVFKPSVSGCPAEALSSLQLRTFASGADDLDVKVRYATDRSRFLPAKGPTLRQGRHRPLILAADLHRCTTTVENTA